MNHLSMKVHRFLASEDGPTTVEYSVMLALIILVCIAAVRVVGTTASDSFQSLADQIGTSSKFRFDYSGN